jgi:hypothetical protein
VKQFSKILMFLGFVVFLMVGSASALPLPAGDFAGGYSLNISTGELLSNQVKLTGTWYLDGTYSDADAAVKALVTSGFSGWTFNTSTETLFIDTFATNNFSIGPYLSGTLSNYNVINLGSGSFMVSALLSEMDYQVGDSKFFKEFQDTTGVSKLAQVVAWEIKMGDINNNIINVNVLGKIAPVPEPTQMLLFGSALIGLAGIGRKRFLK